MTYRLHYISADGPGEDATWSVYVEEYAHKDDAEPIDGTQRKVSTWSSMERASAEADRAQREGENA